VFTLYALRDTALPDAGASPDDVSAAMAGHALARAARSPAASSARAPG
jgi:phosphatidylethanolamine-binding protein (PEBP) family uncharacterized protein